MPKKGLSPIIAVVLLIAIAVVMGGILASWISDFVSKNFQRDTCSITTMYSVSDTVYNATSNEVRLKIKNTGDEDLYNFTVEADNGTDIAVLPATYPPASYVLNPGRTQYVIASGTYHNITNIRTIKILVGSCRSYSPTPVNVVNI